MSDRHVVPAEDGWHVEKDNARRPSAKTATQAEAVKRAVEIVANDGGGEVIIHGANGDVRDSRPVPAGADDTLTETVKATAAADTAGLKDDATVVSESVSSAATQVRDDAVATGNRIAGETKAGARGATDTAAEAVTDIAEQARTAATEEKSVPETAEKAAAIARAAGGDVADQMGNTARQVVGEARGTGRRALHVAQGATENGADALRQKTERFATVTEAVHEELDTAADRVARRVHSVTERVARPLDDSTEALLSQIEKAGRALNPVRITGRAVEFGVSITLRTAGVLTFRSGRTAQRATRAATVNR